MPFKVRGLLHHSTGPLGHAWQHFLGFSACECLADLATLFHIPPRDIAHVTISKQDIIVHASNSNNSVYAPIYITYSSTLKTQLRCIADSSSLQSFESLVGDY